MADDIVLARVLGAQGIKGDVALKIFAEEPKSLLRYSFAVGKMTSLKKGAKDSWIAHFEGTEDRTAAEKLAGLHLSIPRSALPALQDGEYYLSDLKGLATVQAGKAVGRVLDVIDFGAGPLLDVGLTTGRSLFLPFREPYCGEVDMAQRTIEIDGYEDFL